MSDEARERLDARLAELGQRYVRRTVEEVGAIRAAMERYARGDAAALQEIERAAHRIRGSGGMFGFTAIGDAAGDLESAAVGQADAERLRQLVERLAAQVDTALLDASQSVDHSKSIDNSQS